MKEHFEDRRMTGAISVTLEPGRVWKAEKNDIVRAIVAVVKEYDEQNYKLTLRQLYYQLVSKDLIPNHDKVYKKLSSILDDCRYSGLIDWDAIEDRGRVPHVAFSVENIPEALNLIAEQYRLDRQTGQPIHIELWTEKDAISGILKRVANKYGVYMCVNKGYTSSSAVHSAYERIIDVLKEEDRKVEILYFGDHDPSGLDMIRDIRERLLFMLSHGENRRYLINELIEWNENERGNAYGVDYTWDLDDLSEDEEQELQTAFQAYFETRFKVTQIGLTKEQIDKYNPPPNPAKISDPRAAWYVKKFGKVSWEVDALPPEVMTQIATRHITKLLDDDVYVEIIQREKKEKAEILSLVEKYKKKL